MGLLTNPLGWVDTVGDKVGRLLADKSPLSPFRSSPNKHAPLPAHESDPQVTILTTPIFLILGTKGYVL